jgi:hypothetical protein
MLFYRAALPLSSRTLTFVCGMIRRHRVAIGSCWRCRDGRVGSDYPLTAPDGGAEPTEEAR